MKDREIKQQALQYSVANHWLPQLEVEIASAKSIEVKAPLITDLDVLTSVPDPFKGFRSVVFDCKTKAKESPVNRSLWLAGVLDRIEADQGYCLLRKNSIEIDHRIFASSIRVILLDENEFEVYAKSTCSTYTKAVSYTSNIDVWDALFSIPKQYSNLSNTYKFMRSTYWMVDDPAEASRKTLTMLLMAKPELDPAKIEHLTTFYECCTLFSRSVSLVVDKIFKAYLHPANMESLSEPLLIMLYGGRDSYMHRNSLFKMIKSHNADEPPSDLQLPEWEHFVQLVRQLLDAPRQTQYTPLILREIGFCILSNNSASPLIEDLCTIHPQAAKFAILISEYLSKATGLPREFSDSVNDWVMPLFNVK